MKKYRILAILAIISLFTPMLSARKPVQAQAGTAFEVLVQINNLRSANGLSPLVENQYLNIASQNHANWIATTGLGGHIGENGSTAADRALAVGYGEGAKVWVTENWARGPGLTAYDCVYTMWAPSAAHIDNMLTTWHNEFGAGVALDGDGFTVYVVKFGHSAGSNIPEQPISTPSGPTVTLAPLIQPVTTATRNPDGSIIHIVQFGQSLWAIADAYDIAMADLLIQNGLTEQDAIFPDQRLLIVPASLEVEEATETEATSTRNQAAQRPTPTPSPTATRPVQPTSTSRESTPTDVPIQRGNFLTNIFSGDTLFVGIGLVVVSILGIALLFYTTSRLK
jgi:uncharacterized protein YkwD/LysM repeat protein